MPYTQQNLKTATDAIFAQALLHEDTWKDKSDLFWFIKLMRHVDRLRSAIEQDNSLETQAQLIRIASIAASMILRKESNNELP